VGKKMMKLVGWQNHKLKTTCLYGTTLKKARQIGNKLVSFLKIHPGLGLSANQVGIMERVCVVKLEGYPYWVMIDPHIVQESKKMQLSKDEGCMSIPGKRFDLKRSAEIEIRWLSRDGRENQDVFTGLDAIIVKHEIDHLNGILLSDYKKNGKLKEKQE